MNKGYTLIELLATIVIMAVIFSIAVPITTSIIAYVRKESFKISVTNIGRAGDLTYSREYIKNPTTRELIFVYNDGVETSNISGVTLDYYGDKPLFGNVVVNKAGNVAASLHNGELCATKEFLSKKVIITEESVEDCVREMHLPQIFLVGENEVFVEVNEPYVDEYVSAFTSLGEPTVSIDRKVIYDGKVVGEVDTSIKGEYLVSYQVIEEDKSSSITRKVNVIDTKAPIIQTPGDINLFVDQVNLFNVMAGVSATDNSLEPITVSATGSLSRLPDSYIITYTASDSSGNEAITTRIINVNDVSAPVITLLGSNPLNLFVNDPYVEAGATALDDIDEDVTLLIETDGSINTSIKGIQYISYSVTDSSGNTANISRTVNVIDNINPTVTFGTNGNNVFGKSRSTTVNVTDLHSAIASIKYAWTTSATAPSNFSTVFTNGASIATPTSVSGDYYLWVEAIDTEGNKIVTSSNPFKLDNSSPVITTPGNESIVINQVNGYNLMTGVSVSDNSSEVLSISVSGNLSRIPGNYIISYTSTDSSGNNVVSTRIITVLDVEAPVITLLGSNPLNLFAGSTYTEAGATATDDVDGNLTTSIVITGTVNTSTVGTYLKTYTVTDSSGNVSTRTRTINILDSTPPTVTFGTNGNATYAKTRSTTVTVTDGESGVLSHHYAWTTSATAPDQNSITTSFANGATITTPASVTGTYYLWIKSRDNATNQSIVRSNAFNLDNTIPVITRNGAASITLALGDSYSELGSTATDNISGTITASIVTSGTVNTSVAGTYTVYYNVVDSSGNAATAVSRTITVNPRTEYRYRDSYTNCDTCYNTCQNSQGASSSYYCSSGYTLSGSTCSRTTSSAASVTYSCSSGSLSGSSCYTPTDTAATPSYTCPSGYSGSGSSCSKTTTTTASSYYYCNSGSLDGSGCWSIVSQGGSCGSPHCCPSGYATADGGTCAKKIGNASIGYSCPSGYTRSGTTCSKTETATASVSYSCPSTWYLIGGNLCYKNVQTAATASYSCPSGCSRSGTTCTCSESTSASTSYSCPSGWSLSGSTCYQSYSCDAYSCNCSSYWGGWSGWSTTIYTANGTRQVETRLVYSL